MDSIIKHTNYDMLSLIKKCTEQKKGVEYYKLFEDAVTSEDDYGQMNMMPSKD